MSLIGNTVLSSHSKMLTREIDAIGAIDDGRVVRTHLHLVVCERHHPTREELVREAAYHRAEARGFAAGHELEDWLVAEAEVNSRMNGEGRAY